MAAAVARRRRERWSMRPKRMSLMVMPLSTVALCWKKSIQGVTGGADVSEDDEEDVLLKPGSGCQVTKAWPTECQLGWVMRRDWNEDQVEYGGGEGDALPGPVAVRH